VVSGTIASADLADQFEKQIIPFWQQAEPRIRQLIPHADPQMRPVEQALADFAGLRLRWARAIAESARGGDAQAPVEMARKTDAAQARMDWFGLRTVYDHRALALPESPAFIGISNVAWFNYRPCARYPYNDINPVAPGDLATDAPARRLALACQAQRFFLTRDFRALDAALENARRHPGDLADGTSSYDGLAKGLDILMDYGGLSVDGVFGRLADWRRAVPGSVMADLVEANALVSWAYTARGEGFANSVTAQNQMIFQHRIAIAQAALQALEPRARDYPEWYSTAINVNLLGGGKEEERQALFDRGHARFPDNLPIDSAMLHALLPRWEGSFEKVAQFIAGQAQQTPAAMPQVEKYARLYWLYSGLEGPEADIFGQAYAKPDIVGLGMAVAMKRFPKSDYLMNVAGRLACQSDQRGEYLTFHASLPKHYSASAWSPTVSVESCDRKFHLKS